MLQEVASIHEMQYAKHGLHMLGAPTQKYLYYTIQVEEQPSALNKLLSSQASPPTTNPSPQIGLQALFEASTLNPIVQFVH